MTTTADEVACAAHNAKPKPQEWFAVVVENSYVSGLYQTRSSAERCAGLLPRDMQYKIRRATLTLGEVAE